jgi:stress response protein SCP2
MKTATRNDITLSCVVLDSSHGHVESISYNRTEGCNGSIRHLGDEKVGDGEKMLVNFDAIPVNVQFLCFCVNGNQGSPVAFTPEDVLLFSAGRRTDLSG